MTRERRCAHAWFFDILCCCTGYKSEGCAGIALVFLFLLVGWGAGNRER